MGSIVGWPDGTSAADRLVAGCLAVVIVLGSALLWIGVPVGGIWLAGRVTADGTTALLVALVAIPAGMVAVGWALGRASAEYEALRGREPGPPGPPSWRASLGEERARARRARGERRLLESAMTVSASTALVMLAIWFFFFAEQRLSPFP